MSKFSTQSPSEGEGIHSPQLKEQALMLGNRLRKNRRRLSSWRKREGVSCYRLYDRDIPELPLAIDLYEDTAGAQHLYIAQYLRRDERSASQRDDWLLAMARAAAESLPGSLAGVHLKRREHQRGKQQYERLGQDKVSLVVAEGGLRFAVNLSDYLDTGLFLDHRRMRAMVGAESAGKRVLNLYAYTGSFSVYAGAGGAKGSTTVDSSRTYLKMAAENLALNDLSGARHELIRVDVETFLRQAREGGRRWDLAVVDPPTFSNGAAMRGSFDVRRDHVPLLHAVAKLLVPGGVLWFSTNARRFSLDEAALPELSVQDRTAQSWPKDFRQRPHQSWRMVCR